MPLLTIIDEAPASVLRTQAYELSRLEVSDTSFNSQRCSQVRQFLEGVWNTAAGPPSTTTASHHDNSSDALLVLFSKIASDLLVHSKVLKFAWTLINGYSISI